MKRCGRISWRQAKLLVLSLAICSLVYLPGCNCKSFCGCRQSDGLGMDLAGLPRLSKPIEPHGVNHEFLCGRVVDLTIGLRPSGPAISAVSLIQISEWLWENGFGAANGFCGTPEFAVGCAFAGAPR